MLKKPPENHKASTLLEFYEKSGRDDFDSVSEYMARRHISYVQISRIEVGFWEILWLLIKISIALFIIAIPLYILGWIFGLMVLFD